MGAASALIVGDPRPSFFEARSVVPALQPATTTRFGESGSGSAAIILLFRRPRSAWPPERVAELTRLWADGLSHGAIARAMRLNKGVVSAKLDRLGLSRPKPLVDGRSNTARRPRVLLQEPIGRGVPLLEVTGCKWPAATVGGQHLFCDAEPDGTRCYCPAHWRRAHA